MHQKVTRRYAILLGVISALLVAILGCAQSNPTATPQPTPTPDLRIDEMLSQLNRLEQRLAEAEVMSTPAPTEFPIPIPTPPAPAPPTPAPSPVPTATPTPRPAPTPLGGDTSPPEFVAFFFSPSIVDVSAQDEAINFNVQIREDLSGLDRVAISYRSPSGNQTLRAFFPPSIYESGPQEVVYEPTLTVPRFSEGGTWVMDWAYVRDRVGNRKTYDSEEFTKLGFPTSFEVVYEEQ